MLDAGESRPPPIEPSTFRGSTSFDNSQMCCTGSQICAEVMDDRRFVPVLSKRNRLNQIEPLGMMNCARSRIGRRFRLVAAIPNRIDGLCFVPFNNYPKEPPGINRMV